MPRARIRNGDGGVVHTQLIVVANGQGKNASEWETQTKY